MSSKKILFLQKWFFCLPSSPPTHPSFSNFVLLSISISGGWTVQSGNLVHSSDWRSGPEDIGAYLVYSSPRFQQISWLFWCPRHVQIKYPRSLFISVPLKMLYVSIRKEWTERYSKWISVAFRANPAWTRPGQTQPGHPQRQRRVCGQQLPAGLGFLTMFVTILKWNPDPNFI